MIFPNYGGKGIKQTSNKRLVTQLSAWQVFSCLDLFPHSGRTQIGATVKKTYFVDFLLSVQFARGQSAGKNTGVREREHGNRSTGTGVREREYGSTGTGVRERIYTQANNNKQFISRYHFVPPPFQGQGAAPSLM